MVQEKNNTASGNSATIGGGSPNKASGSGATVGGTLNTALSIIARECTTYFEIA